MMEEYLKEGVRSDLNDVYHLLIKDMGVEPRVIMKELGKDDKGDIDWNLVNRKIAELNKYIEDLQSVIYNARISVASYHGFLLGDEYDA